MAVLFYDDILNIYILRGLLLYILVVLHPDDLALEKFKSECGERILEK